MDAQGRDSPDGAGPGDRATLVFRGEALLTLYDKGAGHLIRARSRPLMDRLNEVWFC